ncbi:hypothetical protein EOD39_0782 [Acipenser ruthenus]|uniref:Uncharacterized protein n=1 Tax=Acipenser ruthenus TaxID=7906 RepID=A0A662Z032_ACIRT|nr:hypothetical protein EOD39_0782 [Acipenser ruthenus]
MWLAHRSHKTRVIRGAHSLVSLLRGAKLQDWSDQGSAFTGESSKGVEAPRLERSGERIHWHKSSAARLSIELTGSSVMDTGQSFQARGAANQSPCYHDRLHDNHRPATQSAPRPHGTGDVLCQSSSLPQHSQLEEWRPNAILTAYERNRNEKHSDCVEMNQVTVSPGNPDTPLNYCFVTACL